jgi:hypothetical protein
MTRWLALPYAFLMLLVPVRASAADVAVELRGTDEGPAGPHGDGFYAGYFRDLDDNKLNARCMG